MSMDPKEAAALERLIQIAYQDTGHGRKISDFLLAWWNAQTCGGFDLTDFWALDQDVMRDVKAVIGLLLRCKAYPDRLGYAPQFEKIVRLWRPHLLLG